MLLRVISRPSLLPSTRFLGYTRNCFRSLSLLRRVFPMNRVLAYWLYLRICTRNIKSPRVYTRSLSFAYDTLSSACPFSPFLFFSSSFPCSSIHLARFRPSYSLVISSSDTVRSLFMGALPILYISDLWAGKYRFPFT